MITQNDSQVKLNMAESGGHDPHSHKANKMFIKHLPNLWDSLSNHGIIISTLRNHFNGQIDDARIYNYALTATQVKTAFDDGAYRVGPVTGAP